MAAGMKLREPLRPVAPPDLRARLESDLLNLVVSLNTSCPSPKTLAWSLADAERPTQRRMRVWIWIDGGKAERDRVFDAVEAFLTQRADRT